MADAQSILVITGSDPKLTVDLTTFRAVRQQTGLGFTRLQNPTFAAFAAHLRRVRMQSGAMPNLHMAMHMGPGGAEFISGTVSAEKLSEVLSGVPILFLAGCQSTEMGDLLAVVPYVVTLLEDVDHDSARAFSQLFWLAIGSGQLPVAAYEMALKDLPDVAEYAYLHNHTDFLALKATI